jgi:mono-ADP-ribosyltransferase sirtuin 6
MGDTAHKDPEQMKERFDRPEALEEKINRLARLIKQSKHLVVFTGAGISTSAGIHDFRGPNGKWTREAQGLKPLRGVSTISAFPTKTHMALVQLARKNKLKWLISQNCDGLHIRSGFPQDRLSELHGNGNVEICETCGQRYFRDMCAHRSRKLGFGRDHFTGRYCVRENCGGRLLESTIDFGQNLPETPLTNAFEHSEKADLHIALGSSLTVTPAADCPDTTAKNGDLVIINLQRTPLTKVARDHIYAKTDEVMERVMAKLGYEIPPFRLLRKLIIGVDPVKQVFYCRGADVDDPTLEMDFIKHVSWHGPILGCSVDESYFEHGDQKLGTKISMQNGFAAPMEHLDVEFYELLGDRVFMEAELTFAGHYREPSLTLTNDFTSAFSSNQRVEYLWSLEYNPYEESWVSACELSSVGKPACTIDDSYGKSHAKYCMDGLVKHYKYSRKDAKNDWQKHVRKWSKKTQL